MNERSLEAPARLRALLAATTILFAANAAQARDGDHIVIGAGAAVTPDYQGSGNYRVLPIPAIDIQEGPFFVNPRNGVGVAPIETNLVTIGASAVFVPGYRRKDVPTGIEKVSGGLGARVFATVRAAGFVTTLGATKVISGGTSGLIADASVAYPVKLTDGLTVTPTLGTSWANAKHNGRYFGVSATEAMASGLPGYEAGAGFKDVSGTLTASYRLTDRITLSATGGVTALLGDAANSPIVEKEAQPFGVVTAAYRF